MPARVEPNSALAAAPAGSPSVPRLLGGRGRGPPRRAYHRPFTHRIRTTVTSVALAKGCPEIADPGPTEQVTRT